MKGSPAPAGRLRRVASWGFAAGVVLLGVAVLVGALAAVGGGWWARGLWREMVATAEAHRRHDVAHLGWSFPARVWSAPVPLDLPAPRLVAEARARGYAEACPADGPGEVCARDGVVVPRDGVALEPVLAAWLVGPDAEVREHLPLEEAPPHLIAAIVLAEDDAFYDHPGVDVKGILRAAWVNASGGSASQGGSTLTMQVVRGLTQRKERTFERKAREIVQAVAIDSHLGKDGVLQMYLDMPYLGQDGDFSICGFQAASRFYWGKDAQDLTIAQAATLAAILPAPGRYSPDRHPEEARERRDRVLGRMGEAGWDVTAALAEPIEASPHSLPAERWPAYVQAVRMELESKLPPEVVYGAGLDVYTGLDVVVQERSEAILTERVRFLEMTVGRRGDGPLIAAGTAVDPDTGALIAVVDTGLSTSTDFNRATQARRQAGSSFKPLVYALAFRLGPDGKPMFTSDHTLPNNPRVFPGTDGWRPRNVAGRYSVTSTVAWGLTASQNIATASLLEEAGGPEPLVALARAIGFDTSAFPHEMGLALGQGQVTTVEMARFAATIAGGGRRMAATPVVRAVDARGRVRLAIQRGNPVLAPETAALTRELMRLVVDQGTGGGVRGGAGFAGYDGEILGKTGTTDNERDLWFVGATPTYAAAVWLGYDEPAHIGASASDFSAPLFGWWMREIHADLPLERFPRGDVIRYPICTQTGKAPAESCHIVYAPFLPGTSPHGACDGTHEPETGDSITTHQSLWDLRAAADAAAAAESATPLPETEAPIDTGLPVKLDP